MNQLLSSCDTCFVAAFKDRAYYVCSETKSITELIRQPPKKDDEKANVESSEKETTEEKTEKEKTTNNEDLKDILAVAVLDTGSTTRYCAVSRGEKSLDLYKIGSDESKTSILPSISFHTPKRVGSLCFAKLETIYVLIAGDLAGDAYAYSLEEKQRRRLLGHTASMLTGVAVLNDVILTADRDEKIRISRFPESYVIEGYLLGHTEYITSIDSLEKENLVVSCASDKSVRLWDAKSMNEIAGTSLNLKETSGEDNVDNDSQEVPIPTDITLSSDGSKIAVIFDGSKRLDLYGIVKNDEDAGFSINLVQSIECPAQPLGVVFSTKTSLLVLLKDPDFLVHYKLENGSLVAEDFEEARKLKEEVTKQEITMPETILEKDPWGNPKLKKLQETRGPAGADAPWNRVERIDIAKERNKRHKKRRLEKES